MKNKDLYKILLFLIIVSLATIIFTFGNVAIGGDTMIPLNSVSIEKYLYQWIGYQNGIYFSVNYYPLFLFYKIVEFLGFNMYQASFLLLFTLNFIAGYGIYQLSCLFCDDEKYYMYFAPIFFYLVSPAFLNGWHYMYFYAVAPLFFYFIFKCIKFKNILVSDIIYFGLVIFVASLDLPNPKYLFYLFISTTVIVCSSYLLRLLNLNFFVKNFWKIFATGFFMFYLIIPVVYFATHYSPEIYGIHIKAGYKDVGKMMDYGSATIGKMFRLHHDGLNLDVHDRELYSSNVLIILFSYFFILIIIVGFFFSKKSIKDRKYNIIIFALILTFLFFSKGSNPPFGTIYEFFVSRIALLGFLRTTAGAVFILSVFYSISIFIFLKNIKNKKNLILSLTIIIISITGYPLLNGQFFKNISASKNHAKQNHGYKIPEEYFLSKNEIDKKKIDAKIFFTEIDSSYLANDWGYFGPIFYNFIFKNNIISSDNIYSDILKHNVKLIIYDKSITNKSSFSSHLKKFDSTELKKYDFLTINSINLDGFVPHFYVPTKNIISNQSVEDLPEIVSRRDWEVGSAVFFENQNTGKKKIFSEIQNSKLQSPNELQIQNSEIQKDTLPILEFKKINPTKYRVRVHSATGKFPVVFSESYHSGWKAYLKRPQPQQKSEISEGAGAGQASVLDNYKILDGNEDDQASEQELINFIERGWITSIGDLKEKMIKHQKWNEEKQKEELDYIEKYKIDFISKDFQGTIQNDNLSKGNIFETWFKEPLLEERHLMVNGYANSWIINTDEVCPSDFSGKLEGASGANCVRNLDGSYDMELVVEFWPQRLFYVGVFVSGSTLLGCIVYLGYDWRRRRKLEAANRNEDVSE